MSNEKDLIDKLTKYYNKIKNPTYQIDQWVIANDNLYIELKNKLNIISILSYSFYKDETIVVIEDKKYYYAIKYNSNFICIRKTDTEYGLIIDNYDLLAVNREVAYSNKQIKSINNIPLTKLAKTFDWKLGKKAKEYIKYYTNFN
ncbi:MAG: hypothetical protein EB072_16780 [Betaproteobacteria bacterium]|nr:hypothetical protein [Betaproteobacteria bacterium]